MSKEYVPYYQKLRDPRWQKKRLEIMQRDDFKCCRCGSGDDTLNVHHGYYERRLNPWEYEACTLWTLCEDCHETVTEATRDIHRELAMIPPAQLVATTLAAVVEMINEEERREIDAAHRWVEEQRAKGIIP